MTIREIVANYGKAVDPQGCQIPDLDIAVEALHRLMRDGDLSRLGSTMRLREWYAGKALRVVIEYGGFGEAEPDLIAKWAFEIADAMLAEGRKEAP